MLTMSILLMPLYWEICRAPALALASVPLAVIDIAAPPSPLSRRRMPPAPPLPEPPPSTVPSCLVSPVPMFSRLVRFLFAAGSVFTSSVSRLMRCSGDAVLMSGESPLTVMLSSIAPTSSWNVRRRFCAAPSTIPEVRFVRKPLSVMVSV